MDLWERVYVVKHEHVMFRWEGFMGTCMHADVYVNRSTTMTSGGYE